MCFSEEASFTAAVFLTTVGVLSLKKAKYHPERMMIALIPLFFGLQQGSEGFQWLYQKGIFGTAAASEMLQQIFLFFALLFWPVWMPLSVWVADREPAKKRQLFLLLLLGMATSATIGYQWLQVPTTLSVQEHRLQYLTHVDELMIWPYAISVMAPWLITSLPRTKFLGIVFFIAFGLSSWVYYVAFTSVWCFFCALMSLWIYAIVSAPEQVRSTSKNY
jgi:hypothetical protein